ncbi:PRSS12 [Symbiodinium sp. CCMP2592]|nr:PRSS12 [Symbiodinium sp. CCMP2592]
MLFSVGALSSLLAVARHASAATAAAPAHFLMISGVTAVDETCLAGSAAGVWLESCEKAVAGMSGEEIWSLATDGTLVHARSKMCLSPQGTSAAGVPLALVSCDAAGGVAKWELQGNGQVKMAQSNMCISQIGPSGAAVNAAASASVLNRAARANVRITAEGHPASSGLLEIQTSSGSYGSVCGMNAEAASVACRQLGFEFGVQSPSPCGQYGGGSWCGAAGSPVAVKSLKCLGTEMSVDECSSEAVDDACLSHGSDAVIFCGASSVGAFPDGELRLVGSTGAPALPKEAGRLEVFLAAAQAWAPVCKLGFTSGSASVACKQMGYSGSAGFAGCRSQEACGGVAPQLADLACSGSETSVLQCPMSIGDDVFCAPEESVLLSCAGQGDPIGKPTERTKATNVVQRDRTPVDVLVFSVRSVGFIGVGGGGWHASAATAAAPAHFLMISGVTAVDETCLAGSAAGVWLESCEKAVAGMSGEEIWSLATDGTLVHARSKTCLSPQGTSAAGVPLALVSCDAAGGVAKWELQGNGQVKMAQSNMCISQVGPSGAAVNAAASASVSASSTLDPSHGAALAVDGVASTYWVSKLDEADAVSLLLDFGEPVHGSVLELDFEFAPSAFSVQAAEASSENWLQLFATDSNALKHVKIPLAPAKPMSAVRLIMKEAHPTLGTMNGRKLVGVRSIRLLTRLLQPVLEPCAVAAKSHDARDKFFTVAVSGFDPQAGAALAAEMPALESADAALSSIVVELAKALPAISSCKPGGPISLRANATMQSTQRRREVGDMALDVGQEAALLEEARGTIVAARGLLASSCHAASIHWRNLVLNRAARANVRITAEGHPASSGLLEIQTSSGSYGSVCGMNAEAASVACRQLGFEFGVQSPSPCGQYGGGSWCGAAGSPVAVKSLKCLGTEMSVDECSSEAVDDACRSHGSDAVIFCGASSVGAFPDGELRLVGSTGAPALPKEAGRLEVFLAAAQAWAPVCKLGFTSGSASVACKQMGYSGSAGFAGCRSQEACGGVAPQLADLACSGSETSVLQCPMSIGDDVFCAPEESVLLSCAGQGDPIGKPTERTKATNIVQRDRTPVDVLVFSVRSVGFIGVGGGGWHVSAATAAAPAHFLMISGVTAVDETCLAGSAAGVWLESCEKAVAGMGGEEIWSLATDGTLVHARSKTCLSPQGTSAAGVPLSLVSCDAAGGVAKWELQGNGQVKMAQSNMCISQVGPSGAAVNAAASASVSASSTLDPSHGAALAVDGVASTYWVSKLDEADAVSLLLDFGEPVHGSVLELDFEFAPSAFSVQAAEASSENWLQLFATDSNALKHVKIPLAPAKPMSAVRLIMKEAHPTLGTMNGRKLVGVRSIRLLTRLLQPVLEPCAVAAKSHDARDKFFTVAVSGFDPQAGAALAAEMPALESADAALSSIVVELAKALPAISSCKPGGPISLRANATMQSTQRRREVGDMALDVGQEAALLEEARGTIVAARGHGWRGGFPTAVFKIETESVMDVAKLAMRPLFTGVYLVFAKVLNRAARANVRITAEGHPASSGLLEIQTSSGSYGSVCGMNAEAASVACRQLGFEFGVQSPSPCGQYGGGSWCGAAGSPVAVKSLKCLGTEMSVDECSSEAVDDACRSHGSDAVIFCGASSVGAFPDGELRLVGSTGAPALPKEAGRLEVFLAAAQAWVPVCKLGFTSGSASVACKQMGYSGSAGFAGCRSQEACGGVAPQLADLACSGSETSVLQCPMSIGDDVFCAPEESVLLSCAGQGDPIGKPTAP